MAITFVSLIGQTLYQVFSPGLALLSPLPRRWPKCWAWITAWAGDVQGKGLEPCPAVTGLPALLRVGDAAARLSQPARFALKNIQCHLIPGLSEEGRGETSCSFARKEKIIILF